jgi:hypothetical protein
MELFSIIRAFSQDEGTYGQITIRRDEKRITQDFNSANTSSSGSHPQVHRMDTVARDLKSRAPTRGGLVRCYRPG